ncbi:MAG: DNA recombination protein RmuC [Proteobacteria bacterium]|uniref:DNA recombination protein RmuC homolog n=1 Tax=Candidatus Enterousia excrementavium TaxID=2840789 RepID=A0A940DFX2_9PROT|nr:DNA recombination protein RmuC [Candidatus Enterousia excrementavium]
MTTYIFVLLFIIIVLLVVLLMRRPTVDISSLREDNARLRERLAERLGALSQNAIELKNISADIANFKNILMGNKQARGTFGERQLADLVADIMPPETYSFQTVLDTGVRPDCIIRLPYPPGDMIIDSKFPLESYSRMTELNDDGARKQFELDVRKHIDAIAEKYIIPGKTAESAMMFIASESIFETLHREFPNIIDYAARRKVFIVSPSTLWATLNTIRAVLSDIKIKRVADKIKRELELLLTDLGRLADRAGKVQQHFSLAATDIEQLQTSIGKIAPRAEKLRDMDFES